MHQVFSEMLHALQHVSELRVCSKLISSPAVPLSSYEAAVIKQEEAVSWKLWLSSFGTYIALHQGLSRMRVFKNRPVVPQFVAIVPALAVILAGGALFRQRTIDRLVHQPPAAQKEATLIAQLRDAYPTSTHVHD